MLQILKPADPVPAPVNPISLASAGRRLTKLEKLFLKVDATKKVRFEAHRRLAKRHRLSSYVISMLSLYVIAISLLPNVWPLDPTQSQVLLGSIIVLSVFIIILSLAEGSESFHHQAEVLHDSARRIAKISNQLYSYMSSSDKFEEKQEEELRNKDAIELFEREYQDVLDSCHLNHSVADYLRVRATVPTHFPYTQAQSKLGRTVRRCFDYVQATLSEYSWLFMPSAFALATLYLIYVSVFIPEGASFAGQSR
jgi:hypothetical protein